MKGLLMASVLLILMIAGCVAKKSGNPESPSNVFTGGKWIIHEISGTPVDPSKSGKEPPFMDFNLAEKRMSAYAGCNRMSAGFELSNDTITFSPIIATRMACPDMQYEYALERLLVPGGYTFEENDATMILYNNKNKVLEFKRSVPVPNK